MRKIFSLLLALILMLSCAATAKEAFVEHDFGHFKLTIPADAVGSISDEITANEPFLTIYENYDENALFNKSLDCVWNENLIDLSAMDPAAYAQNILDTLVSQFTIFGIVITDAEVLEPAVEELGGAEMFSCMLCMNVDYTAVGIDLKTPTYTLLAMMSDEAVGGSYSFTVTTDDLDSTTMLLGVMDSIQWTL